MIQDGDPSQGSYLQSFDHGHDMDTDVMGPSDAEGRSHGPQLRERHFTEPPENEKDSFSLPTSCWKPMQ